MCGIIAYVGNKPCRSFIMEGLARLEYRGYDSAGFVCIDDNSNHLSFVKTAGRLQVLAEQVAHVGRDGVIGMGHTRWATHGVATSENAHPHFDCAKRIAVVHNGIIEQHLMLRERLEEQGHIFSSGTDTEVIAHVLESLLDQHISLEQAIVGLVSQLSGSYALILLCEDYPDRFVAVRHKSPLVVGVGAAEMYIASDPLVFSDKTNQVLFLPSDSFAIVQKDHIALYSFDGTPLSVQIRTVCAQFNCVTKDGFAHYMLKEIYEQQQAITRTVVAYESVPRVAMLEQLALSTKACNALTSISMVAAGTSWHAARIGQFFFESVARIPARVHLASEFRYMPLFVEPSSVCIGISQSGETADTLEALRVLEQTGAVRIGLTNVPSSTILQETEGHLLMHAGPEVSVGSTKAFSTQLATLYWLAHVIAHERRIITDRAYATAIDELLVAASVLEAMLEEYKGVVAQELAPLCAEYDRAIFLGRHISYPFAMEAALKLKEISYIFTQCYPAGELKHGPIALVDQRTPVVLFSVLDPIIYQKLVSNAQEVKARKGNLLVFAFEGQEELIRLADRALVFPRINPLLAPLAMSGVMQLLVYHVALRLGLPIDNPRNLAKSVTVE